MCFLMLYFLILFKASPSALTSFLLISGSITQMNDRISLIITFITTLLKHLVSIYKTCSNFHIYICRYLFISYFSANTLLLDGLMKTVGMCYEMAVYDVYRTRTFIERKSQCKSNLDTAYLFPVLAVQLIIVISFGASFSVVILVHCVCHQLTGQATCQIIYAKC